MQVAVEIAPTLAERRIDPAYRSAPADLPRISTWKRRIPRPGTAAGRWSGRSGQRSWSAPSRSPTDLGTGQPLEHALRTAVLAVRLGELAGASPEELADTYYVALLHASGCTSNGHEAALLFGEDIEHRAAFFLIDPADPAQVVAFYRTHVGPGRPPEVRERMIEAALSSPERAADSFAAMCEVAQRFAGWLELGPGVEAALEYVFARWDGKGLPSEAGGEELPLPARLLHVARDFSLFLTAAGRDDARAVLERRSGAAYDPRLAELGARHFGDVCEELDDTRMWEQALEVEPFPQVRLVGDRIDAGFAAFAALDRSQVAVAA